MIRAEKGGPLGWAWARYIDWRLARDFRGVWQTGGLWPEGDASVLVYANHSSWWDGFALWRLARAYGFEPYCMMEEQNLRRWRFLRRLGAFSIRRGDAQSTLESLRYAAGLLAQPRTMVCVFPQGVLDPHAGPPYVFDRGIEVLARIAKARCMPVAIRLAFFEDEKPDLLMELGPSHPPRPLDHYTDALGRLRRSLGSATPSLARSVNGRSMNAPLEHAR